MVRRLLRTEGYDVLTANDGAEGLIQTALCRPELVISELSMPVIDGLELARRIKSCPSGMHTALIALASQDDDVGEKARTAGFDAVLRKPVTERKFAAMMGAYRAGTSSNLSPAAEGAMNEFLPETKLC